MRTNTIAFTCLQNNPSKWIVNDDPKVLWTKGNCPWKGRWRGARPGSAALSSRPVPAALAPLLPLFSPTTSKQSSSN